MDFLREALAGNVGRYAERYPKGVRFPATKAELVGRLEQNGVPGPVRSADAFVDSIGVNTHLGYFDTVYDDEYPLVKDKLAALGVRHIRDEAEISPYARRNEIVNARYKELGALGIRLNLLVDPRKPGLGTVDRTKSASATNTRVDVDAFVNLYSGLRND